MAPQADFKKLTDVTVDTTAPLILIYSAKSSSRLHYTCSFIFNRVLGVKFKTVTDLKEFENTPGFKINYSLEQTNAGVQIIPHPLIFETGIHAVKPEPVVKDGMVVFFENKGPAFSYDVFSAVFYFISRYEEYQDFEKDVHARFEANQSLAFKNEIHLKPFVDLWIFNLRKALQEAFPALAFPERRFQVVSTIDVDNLYAYRYKGFIRTVGASIKDLAKLDFKNLAIRLRVLFAKVPDPFDVYEDISLFCQQHNIPLYWFFLFKTGTKYDRTVDPGSNAFKRVFGIVKKNKSSIGLHPSYDSAFKDGVLKQELDFFKLQSGESVYFSRQHYLRFNIKTTPALLLKHGILADFSMGFASSPGFRAGTSHPFPFYDFDLEKETPLIFIPFCGMDGAYFVYSKITPEQALDSLLKMAHEIKKTNGIFISVFHERTFSDHLYPGFGTLYKNLHLKLKEL